MSRRDTPRTSPRTRLLRGLEADQRIELGAAPAPYRVTIALNQARNHVRNARRRGEVLTSFDERELRGGVPHAGRDCSAGGSGKSSSGT